MSRPVTARKTSEKIRPAAVRAGASVIVSSNAAISFSASRPAPACSRASATRWLSFRSSVLRLRFHRPGEPAEWTAKQAIQNGEAGCFQRLATARSKNESKNNVKRF
jgi:hypothetical protein